MNLLFLLLALPITLLASESGSAHSIQKQAIFTVGSRPGTPELNPPFSSTKTVPPPSQNDDSYPSLKRSPKCHNLKRLANSLKEKP